MAAAGDLRGNFRGTSALSSTLGVSLTQDDLDRRRQEAIDARSKAEEEKRQLRLEVERRREESVRKKLEEEQREAQLKTEREREEAVAKAEAERRRQSNLVVIEHKFHKAEEDRLRLLQLERKREAALMRLERSKIETESELRAKREAILKKRQEAEIVRLHNERDFKRKQAEEEERKQQLMADIARRREERQTLVEQRRTNPLYIAHEREFKELLAVQSQSTKVRTKLEALSLAKMEADRRVTEADRQLKILVADRDDMDLTLQELKAELRKVATYEDALARLVSTRYDSDTYRASIVKMQSTFRMFAARAERRKLTMDVAHQRRDNAAAKIQKWFRSLKGRWLMRIVRMNKMAIRIQKLWRGGVVRSFKKLLKAIKKLQKVFRGFKARKVFRQMRAVIAAKAFDGIQAAQQVQMTKKVRSKKRKKAKDTESKEDDSAKAAAPAEVMVVSSQPTSSRPISARRPSNPAPFSSTLSMHSPYTFAASGRPLSGRTLAPTPATRTVTPRVVPESVIMHAHALARKPVSAPSGETFQAHGHKHRGRIIKAASKHADALQYFQPYAAGSGTSGTDTDGEEFSAGRRVAFSSGGQEPQRPSTSSHPHSSLKGRGDRPTSGRSPPRASAPVITPWSHDMHGVEAAPMLPSGSGPLAQAYEGLAAFGLFKPVRYSVAEEVQKIYLQPVRPMDLPARVRRDLRTFGGDAR